MMKLAVHHHKDKINHRSFFLKEVFEAEAAEIEDGSSCGSRDRSGVTRLFELREEMCYQIYCGKLRLSKILRYWRFHRKNKNQIISVILKGIGF